MYYRPPVRRDHFIYSKVLLLRPLDIKTGFTIKNMSFLYQTFNMNVIWFCYKDHFLAFLRVVFLAELHYTII